VARRSLQGAGYADVPDRGRSGRWLVYTRMAGSGPAVAVKIFEDWRLFPRASRQGISLKRTQQLANVVVALAEAVGAGGKGISAAWPVASALTLSS